MQKKNTIIAVAGGTASGKTTVANKIMEIFKEDSVTLISTDNYYKDYSNLSFDERRKINYDHPNTVDIELLSKNLIDLKNNKEVKEYIYDFKNSIRTKKTIIVKPRKVIILEGILILAIKQIRDLVNIKMFIKTDDDIRLIRRLERDMKLRKRTFKSVIDQYLTTVKPMHDLLVEPSTRYADIIIPYYEGNEVAVDLILSKVKSLINKK